MEGHRSALRRQALSRRASLSPVQCREWSELIQARALALPQYLDADSVALYAPVQNEVATERIRDRSLSEGKRVFYPKLSGQDGPAFARIWSSADFAVGRFGVPEPTSATFFSPPESGRFVAFVPGVLFDFTGHRLGRGGGWYDRALRMLFGCGVFIALAYEFQIVDSLPTKTWDRKVHLIITEDRIIDCGETPQGLN
jgi:5-formyltetrahydrofolate cyclo-ligase